MVRYHRRRKTRQDAKRLQLLITICRSSVAVNVDHGPLSPPPKNPAGGKAATVFILEGRGFLPADLCSAGAPIDDRGPTSTTSARNLLPALAADNLSSIFINVLT